jgi:hypothetical protein
MSAPSTTPNYACSTTASLARAAPQSPISKISTPRRLKRPPMLPALQKHQRSEMGSLSIHAADDGKPCSIASLPTELRLCIYSYLLPSEVELYCTEPKVWDSDSAEPPFEARSHCWHTPRQVLFNVCRKIRAETTYEVFAKSKITLPAHGMEYWNHICYGPQPPLDTMALLVWHKTGLSKLSLATLSLLAVNPNVTLPWRLGDHGMDPWILFPTESEWKLCERFGNIYSISGRRHKWYFWNFCMLATWLLRRVGPALIAKHLDWTYEIDSDHHIGEVKAWFDNVLRTVALPCVQAAWVRERREGEMKKHALALLDAVDRFFEKHRRRRTRSRSGEDSSPSEHETWVRKIVSLRRFLNDW